MKIAAITSSRADFGLLTPLLEQIHKDPETTLQLIVTGSHWSAAHGMTVDEIRDAGFEISGAVDSLLSEDDRHSVNTSLGRTVIEVSDELSRLGPDICIVLGDRYEILACAIAATVLGIPLAHIHGGELTFGAMDDCFRHAITKMSYLHFTSTEVYRQRVIQLGESQERVFTVGSLGVENIRNMSLLDRSAALAEVALPPETRYCLLTYHPETLSDTDDLEALDAILLVLERYPDLRVIATMANADPGGNRINCYLRAYADRRPESLSLFPSLGALKYLSLMQGAEFIIGNSSSVILEAPAFGIPGINIGRRQSGRIQAESTVNCDPAEESIRIAVQKVLDPDYRRIVHGCENPYNGADTSQSILKHIKRALREGIDLRKGFYDLGSGGSA